MAGGREGNKTTPIRVKGTGSVKEQCQEGTRVPRNLKVPTVAIPGGRGGTPRTRSPRVAHTILSNLSPHDFLLSPASIPLATKSSASFLTAAFLLQESRSAEFQEC